METLRQKIYDTLANTTNDKSVNDPLLIATDAIVRIIYKGCICTPDETTGETYINCCNICGLTKPE